MQQLTCPFKCEQHTHYLATVNNVCFSNLVSGAAGGRYRKCKQCGHFYLNGQFRTLWLPVSCGTCTALTRACDGGCVPYVLNVILVQDKLGTCDCCA